MKERILKLLKKSGNKKLAKDYGFGTKNYEKTMFVMSCNGSCLYLRWDVMKVQFNIMADKLTVFVDERKIAEE